jgi:hypothetical protein
MLTSKDLAELFAETPPCETCEIAKNQAGRGFQQFSSTKNDAKFAKLLNGDNPTTSLISHVSQSCESVGEPTHKPFLATSRVSQGGIAANDDELMTDEAALFWSTFLARVTKCDRLIHQLCELRGDDEARRADLLAVRKRMAPARLDGDIAYLENEIASHTPVPVTQQRGLCIECASFVRAGRTERCGHPDRMPVGEPGWADCLPSHHCERFIHWRAKP